MYNMVIRTGIYEVDRARLVRWANLTGQLKSYYSERMVTDLIREEETTFTVMDLLEYMQIIPGQIIDNVGSYNAVWYKCIKVVYNKKKRTDIDEISYKRGEGV